MYSTYTSDSAIVIYDVLCSYHDEASQFVYVVIKAASAAASNSTESTTASNNLNRKSDLHVRNYVVAEDMVTLIQDVVDSHPGLGFLKEATEFHSRYVHTVSTPGQ